MLARISHPMHTYLLGRRRIRAFVARLTRTQTKAGKGKRGARMPITGLTSASEPKHTQETNCQSLDLCRTPTRKHLHWNPNATRWTYISFQAHNKAKQRHRRPERSAHLLPTYLIWYEDQGDVVPLRRDTGLA